MKRRGAGISIARWRHTAAVLWLWGVLLGGFAIPSRAAEPELDRAALFDAVVKTVEKEFFDVQRLREIDWSARAQAVRPKVLAAPTQDDAVRAINALLAELKTSHTGLFTPDDYFYYMLLDLVGLR